MKRKGVIRKEVGFRRIVIKWGKKTEDGITGIITLDHFKFGVASIPETFTCSCHVGDGTVGMSGIGPTGLVVPLTEVEMGLVNEMMRWYFAGRKNKKETYYWFMEE